MKNLRQFIIAILIGILACPLLVKAAELSQYAGQYFTAVSEPPKEMQLAPIVPGNYGVWPIDSISSVLGWTPGGKNICGGYYEEPAIVLNYPNPADLSKETTTITADQSAYFSQTGVSTLTGNVVVTQPGREVTADKAYVYRDTKTGKINVIDLFGNVHFREAGKLVVAESAHIELATGKITLKNAVYRFAKVTPGQQLNAWGTVQQGIRDSSGILNLTDSTYSTCPPTTNTWKVRAQHLRLNKESGEGRAINSFLDVGGVPLFYIPYFTFPIDNRRKSGFLFSTFGYSRKSGADITVPYYLNLAPNYDATIAPELISKRGVKLNSLFRYLTPSSSGALNLAILPDDNLFQLLKDQAPALYAEIPNEDAYLSRLNDDSDTRWNVAYNNTSVFDEHWSNIIDVNYVSDDYYLQDFGATPGVVTADQLLNRGDLRYDSEHWHFLGRVQGYQTLHPINEAMIQNQYADLPELDLAGDYPDQWMRLDYHLDSQFVYFDQQNDFITRQPVVTGERYRIVPRVSLPLANASGYFTPQVQLDETVYGLTNQTPGLPSSINRTVPMFDIDSGLYFDRSMNFMHKTYDQTLEPRIFYLYVPVINQNDIPIFDTTLPPFSYEQMFQTNRFTGFDRIGDANQVTTALTSRLLDDYDGLEKLRASIGEIFFFHKREVQCNTPLCMPDPTINDQVSPLVGELSYNLDPRWNLTGDLAWDPNRTRTNNGGVNLTYNNNQRIFNIGYQYVHAGDVIDTNDLESPHNNLNRLNLGVALPLTERWSAMGNWNYNISHSRSQAYFYGLEYNSCCWAVRGLISHTLIATDQLGRSRYDTEEFIQVQLKGLGNVGNNDPSSLITSAIPGYRDTFNN